ncbi:MAG: class I SAM-dependent methyltransferase [Gammaproteobacteria bacterium]|nr:class I SAM-dependent methyltransferase [Gammaproteobacteria bacterium]
MNDRDAYAESFAARGSKYDKAMKQVPESRREEFMAVVDELPASQSAVVLDVPAGGGYLRGYLPARFEYRSYEPVSSFKSGSQEDVERSLLLFPQGSESVDVVASVAGIHHFQDKEPLFREMARVTRPGGQLILADVHHQSSVAAFLDGYVDASNSTGHRGFYLGDHTLEELENCGWHVSSAQRKHYHWMFGSEQQMAEYCHLLFDICHSDFAETRMNIEESLGIDQLDDGRFGMRWELFVIVAEKNVTS